MMRQSLSICFFLACIICSCSSRENLTILVGHWRHISNDNPELVLGYSSVLTFLNDSLVDTRHPYARVVRSEDDERRVYFLPTITKYRIEDDSLSFFDLYDSVWTKPRHIDLLTNDSLILNRDGIKTIYVRVNFESTSSRLDEIVLSPVGCYGVCPITNIIIRSTGEVIYLGEGFIDKVGYYRGQISNIDFEEIEYAFRIAAVDTLPGKFGLGGVDGENIHSTFLRDGKIVNSIDDDHTSPEEFQWASHSLRLLPQNVELEPMEFPRIHPYKYLHYFSFIDNEMRWQLTKSESFLLWNYIREGSIIETDFKPSMSLDFQLNGNLLPDNLEEVRDEHKRQYPDCPGGEFDVESIETDGRYFRFKVQNQTPMIFDIGFNFLERNRSFARFEKRDEPNYDDSDIEEELED